MSTEYKKGSEVPTTVICQRLTELSEAITEGKKGIEREFTMRVPAELDRDPDLVMSIAASRLSRLQMENERLKNDLDSILCDDHQKSPVLNSKFPHNEPCLMCESKGAEQRVVRECMEMARKRQAACVDEGDCAADVIIKDIKEKYHLG